MIDSDNTCILLGRIDNYSRAEQLAACRMFAKNNNLPRVEPRVFEHNEVKKLIHSLRGDEAILVPRLDVFKARPGRGVRDRLLLNVTDAVSKSAGVYDISSKLCSKSPEWRNHVKNTANRVAKTRPLKKNKAASMGRAKKHRGIVRKWKDMKGDEAYNDAAFIWGNLSISEAQATAMLPKELSGLHTTSIRRIFKSRKTCAEWLSENC